MFKGRHLSGIAGGAGDGVGEWYFFIFTLLHVQSNLNTFVFGFFWWKKINYFHGWGIPPPPFAENSVKIINLILATFPY